MPSGRGFETVRYLTGFETMFGLSIRMYDSEISIVLRFLLVNCVNCSGSHA
jgi:hypothetical protein